MERSGTPIPDELAARLFHEALEQLSWQHDPKALATLVERLNLGLPTEDELSVILSWLGNCRLIHKLDQLQTPPTSKDQYRVPDLLALFDYRGAEVPVLIEAKSKQNQSLSWRPDYYEGLQRYGQALHLPVLVAWKFHSIWTLFDLRHFRKAQKNYKIDFETAMKHSLMGILAGDFVYCLREGVGFHISFLKKRLVEETQEDETKHQKWLMEVDNVYFTDGENNRVKNLPPGLWTLFLSYNQEELTETTDTHIIQSFVTSSDSSMQFAHVGIVRLLEFVSSGEGNIRWRDVLRDYKMPSSRTAFREAAAKGIETNFVQMVIDQIPETIPDLLNV